MKLGIVPSLDRGGGGIYQYSATLLAALPDAMQPDDELVVFLYGGETLPTEVDASRFTVVEMRALSGTSGALWYRVRAALPPALVRWVTGLLRKRSRAHGAAGPGDGASLVDPRWRAFFSQFDTDMLLFTADSDLAFRSGCPFAVAIHDIQHRLHPEFPEVSANGEWETREFRIGNCVRKAAMVLVDSEVGREDIVEAYGIPAEAVAVVPFLPAGYLRASDPRHIEDVRLSLDLPERFLFYPAAFWPHKNHARIVRALAVLRDSGLDLPLILVGPHSGPYRDEAFAEVMSLARTLGVSDLVRYLGYVDDDVMSVLYETAMALVMPTFFGPTNIPVVEAFKLGCPVITSDIRGIREQVADAAILVDPTSHESIAEGIRRIAEDDALRARLVERGQRRLEGYSAEQFGTLVRHAVERGLERTGTVGDEPALRLEATR